MPLTTPEPSLVRPHDLGAPRAFCGEAVGMRVGFRPPLGFPGHWVYIGDTPVIHIAEWVTYTERSKARGVDVSTRASGTGPVDHIAFAAQDYDGVLARLQRLGSSLRVTNTPGTTVRHFFHFA